MPARGMELDTVTGTRRSPMSCIPSRTRIATLILTAAAVVFGRSATAESMKTYISVGDSMAFGETDFGHNPSNAERGYVKGYADSLAARNGGVRPNVIGLGVDAETTSTFMNGGTHGDGTVSGLPAPQLNTNYSDPSVPQNTLLLSKIASEAAAGHVVSNVSVQLGANDLFVVANSPGFFALSDADKQAQIAAAFGTIQQNYTTLLTEL